MDAESRTMLTRARDALMRTDIAKPDLSAQLEWAETVHTIDAALARHDAPPAPAASDEELARVAYDAGAWFDANTSADSLVDAWEPSRCAHIARAVHAHVLAQLAPVIEACAAFVVLEAALDAARKKGVLEAALDAARKKGVL